LKYNIRHTITFLIRDLHPQINQVVTYAVSCDKQGRACATQATLTGNRFSQDKKRPNELLPVMGAAIFLFLVFIAVLTSNIPIIILTIYLVASLVAYVAYAMDKSAAKKGAWRTKENTLHLLSLIGGWPGAIFAQKKLRHKSKKVSFRAVFWVTVFLNCGLFAWFLTPTGSATLRSLITAL
jgi:Predicted membrane protein